MAVLECIINFCWLKNWLKLKSKKRVWLNNETFNRVEFDPFSFTPFIIESDKKGLIICEALLKTMEFMLRQSVY